MAPILGGEMELDYDLQWYNKPPTRMAESLWMTFAPIVKVAPSAAADADWRMDKLGRWVDPLATCTNGSKTVHAVWSGVKHLRSNSSHHVSDRFTYNRNHTAKFNSNLDNDADIVIETLDAALVSPGRNILLPSGYFNQGDDGEAHPGRGWHFNLFNNGWDTNYPLWSLSTADRFRWKVTLRE